MIDFSRLAFEAALRGGLRPSLQLLSGTWEILVGEDASRHTRPVSIEGGVVTIAVRPDWMVEWTRHQDTLLADIGRYIPGIQSLDFVEGEFDPVATLPASSSIANRANEIEEDLDLDRQLEMTLARIAKLRADERDA